MRSSARWRGSRRRDWPDASERAPALALRVGARLLFALLLRRREHLLELGGMLLRQPEAYVGALLRDHRHLGEGLLADRRPVEGRELVELVLGERAHVDLDDLALQIPPGEHLLVPGAEHVLVRSQLR